MTILSLLHSFFFITLPQKHYFCKLYTVYRYIFYKRKTLYGHFTHSLHKEIYDIESLTVEKHLYTKFWYIKTLKPKNVLVIFKKSVVFAYVHYIDKSIGTPSNERFDYFCNFHEYKS